MTDLQRKPPLAVLIAVFTPPTGAIMVTLPSMPGLQTAFGVDYADVQLTLTVYLIGLGLTQLFYGPVSDRYGRRPALIGGYALFIVGSLVSTVAPSIETLTIGRALQALGVCSGLVLARAIVRDLCERDQAASVLAKMTGAMTVALMALPTVGSFLDVQFGWRAVFLFQTAVGVGVLAAVFFSLRETHEPDPEAAGFREYLPQLKQLFRERAFWGYAVCLSTIYATYSAWYGGAPYVVIRLMAFSPEEFGLFMGAMGVSYAAGNFIAGRIAVRFGVDPMVSWGSLAGVVCAGILTLVLMSGTLTPLTLFVAMFPLWLSQGLVVPTGMAGSVSVNPRLAGAAAGFTGFMQMALGAGATYLVGALLADTAAPVVLTILAGCTIAWLAHGLGVRWVRR